MSATLNPQIHNADDYNGIKDKTWDITRLNTRTVLDTDSGVGVMRSYTEIKFYRNNVYITLIPRSEL